MRARHNGSSERAALAIQRLWQPVDIGAGRASRPELPNLQRNKVECSKRPAFGIKVGDVHQRKITSIHFPACDPFVVVQEVAAAIQDRAVTVDLDAFA